MADAMTAGSKAPTFALANQDDKIVKLDDCKGKWVVLYFYPKDDTPGCTVEACDFTDQHKAFERLEAVVFGCSMDSTESHRKFIAKHKLKIDLLSDPDHAVMDQYGAWGEKSNYGKTYMGIVRSTAIIDPRGKIAHHWPTVRSAGHAEAVQDKLKELGAGG